ncbi:MAG: hypothetical protein AAF409_10510 [Pseudomonadota bacterium]
MRLLGHGLWVVTLTFLTQLGGIAWLIACLSRHRWAAFLGTYAVLSVGAAFVAPQMGRVPLPCIGEPLRMQSLIYCAMNRHYVVPEMALVLQDLAEATEARHPRTPTLVLDASFPFGDGFPLLPHLSHDDGEKVDLAFHYRDADGYRRGVTRSPIGYFAFEQGRTDCAKRFPTLRWDLDWLQPLWPDLTPDRPRMRTVMAHLTADRRVGKILLEPHLTASWGVAHPKVRFQGCHAARHDDHIHIQL